ncbi:TetR family transcriptional regulator [Citromicrobium bathyomarinum]|uniref:TetR family transcriptional regulator n=1 Tax=Citromicrobium bathyomarinum TaxID=72174 RepID=UPI00315AED86
MTNSGSTVRDRLQQAAVELFLKNGFDDTTAAQIADRAGVTERTFFRHFRDKREVLFDGQAVLADALTKSIADAPPGTEPLDLLFRAFGSVTQLIEANRPFSKPRQDVISATPALQERELSKLAALTDILAAALRERGVPAAQATMAAHVGMAAFADATLSWLENEEPGLADRLDQAEKALRSLF